MQYSRKSESVRARALRRALGALLICSALVCVAAPAARAGSDALWIGASGDSRVDEYLPSQLKSSGTPTPLTISVGTYAYGACFDKSKNLWVTDDDEEILEFTASELKKLPTVPSPAVTISSSSFAVVTSCAFDKHGNLWVGDYDNNSLDEISAAQLKAGSGPITPAVIITGSFAEPAFVTFDKSGNLWTDGEANDELFEFSASQLTSGGSKTAKVVLEGGGSLSDPGQIGFDGKGNLWVTNYGSGTGDTVVRFSKSQLISSNDDPPTVTISSSSLVGPWGLAFDSGDLWVLNYGDYDALEFSPGQLKSSGTVTPKVVLTGATTRFNWQITFGPAFGKLP
jgi:sugar lactone lactonase YvrE